jgi:hypothetical protein
MKEQTAPLPPVIKSALDEVAGIADGLAETFCVASVNSSDLTACLDNLDFVAGCLTWKELDHAPAMLQAAARAFRHTFPADSVGWEEAGRLESIATLIQFEMSVNLSPADWQKHVGLYYPAKA